MPSRAGARLSMLAVTHNIEILTKVVKSGCAIRAAERRCSHGDVGVHDEDNFRRHGHHPRSLGATSRVGKQS